MREEVMDEYLKLQALTAEQIRKNHEEGSDFKVVFAGENLIFHAEVLRTQLLIQEHIERQTIALENIAKAWGAPPTT